MDGIKIGLSDGLVATLDDASVKALAGALACELKRMLWEGMGEFRRASGLSAIRTAVGATREDVKYVRRSLAPAQREAVRETSNLRGAKRLQWEWFCRRRSEAPQEEVKASAELAIRSVRDAGGYAVGELGAFVTYANRHRSWWEGAGNGK